MSYVVKGNYYVDIDQQHQLRITGPGNHLLCGLTLPSQVESTITKCELIHGQLQTQIQIDTDQYRLHYPLVTDIRTLRSVTEPVVPTPSYMHLLEANTKHLLAQEVKLNEQSDGWHLISQNTYEDGQEYVYGCELIIPSQVSIDHQEPYLHLTKHTAPIEFTILTISNISIETIEESSLYQPASLPTHTGLDPFIYEVYEKTGEDIDHLVRTKKTSSFEYGTIFPRDWIEAADLGENDFNQRTLDYMYEQSMKYVNDKGEGWHEEIIGQYKTRVDTRQQLVDRKMIDIEPHYLLGMSRLSNNFLSREDIHHKFIAIGRFVIHNAQEQNLISFKRLPDNQGYYFVGNWRDSAQAFPNQTSPLSPYDVNCVFYPEALRLIKAHAEYLQQTDLENIDKLISKWDENKQKFRLYHDPETIGYSLALHGKKNLPIPVAHLDESYDLFYNRPSIEEVDSFARKVIDPAYFYTPVGPILVDAETDSYSTKQYHGQVIWPKQAAFVVVGLSRQYQYGICQSWPEVVLANVKSAMIKTAEACFQGWKQLEAIPELYYYDRIENRARFYTDQTEYEGQMSLVQLWSAVGARRIIREYLDYLE